MRAEGWGATASLLTFCLVAALRMGGEDVRALWSGAFWGRLSGVSKVVESVPGGSALCTALARAWAGLDAILTGIWRFLNPFEGAADALRLPPVKVRFQCDAREMLVSGALHGWEI